VRTTLKLLVGIGLALTLGRAQADTINVDVRSNFFRTVSAVPGQGTASTTINAGDTVLWTWAGVFHSVVSDDDLFESMIANTGATFSHTFNTPGTFRYYCSVHGGPNGVSMAGTIVVQTKISGMVELEDCMMMITPLTFTFHPSDNSGDIERIVLPTVDGAFTVGNLPAKNYTLRVKGMSWLANSLAVNTTNGSVTDLDVGMLRGGDANDDNSVDVLDLDQLIQSFDKCHGDTGYIEGADFNCDHCVDVLDLDILIRNFDQQGA
jgi:plastocyanin